MKPSVVARFLTVVSLLVTFFPWLSVCVKAQSAKEACTAEADDSTSCAAQAQGHHADNTTTETERHGESFKRLAFCQDTINDCGAKIETGQSDCIQNFTFMSQDCAKSCRICSTKDPNPKTIVNHKKGLVERVFAAVPQVIDGKSSIDTWLHLRRVEEYMYTQVYVESRFEDVRVDCQLRHELCTFWAASGECENNPKYMKTTCAPACQSCLHLKFEHRCPLDTSGPEALSKPGDLYRMFERILTDPLFAKYQPKALSRPTNQTVDDAPWLLMLENVLTPQECDMLIAQGAARGYKRSSEVGHTKRFDGRRESVRSERRTSSTTWCKKECADHPVAMAVHDNLEALTGITQQNYEYLQILKYEVGEKYTQHHDYIDHHVQRNFGPRVLTVYIYLNDVPAGGGTRFPDLNLTVTPKQGRVVIWPSVLDSDSSVRDPRTEHEALPVEEGVKYGTNAWIHQRDFKTPAAQGCT